MLESTPPPSTQAWRRAETLKSFVSVTDLNIHSIDMITWVYFPYWQKRLRSTLWVLYQWERSLSLAVKGVGQFPACMMLLGWPASPSFPAGRCKASAELTGTHSESTGLRSPAPARALVVSHLSAAPIHSTNIYWAFYELGSAVGPRKKGVTPKSPPT